MNGVIGQGQVAELEATEDVFVLPTSFAQQRLWLLDQLNPQAAAYNMPTALRLIGDLDIEALEQSLSEIVRRHEILRTTFRAVDDEPMQVIAPARAVRLPITDLRELEPGARAQEERRLINEEAWTPFDLSCGPLLRTRLFRTGTAEHVLVIVQHHITNDGWSKEVFMRELIIAYEAFSEGCEPELPELPIQYADFAQWQRELLQGETLEQELEYWRSQLADLPGSELPTDRRRPPIQTFAGATESFTIAPELSNALKNLSKRERATLFATLLTAFKVLTARYCGQEDIVVGTPSTNRTRAEFEPLIGFFVNTLVIRTKLDADPTFREALRRVRQTVLGALEHQDLPFDRLVHELAPTRNVNQTPFFQVMFALAEAHSKTRRMADLQMVPIEIKDRFAKFDLLLEVTDERDTLRGSLNYNVDLFDAATIRRMAGHFCTLLAGIVANPEARLSELPLLDDAERQQILVDWNDTGREYPATNICLHELIEKQVERTPDAVALIFEEEPLTYRELNRRANRLAHRLRQLGVGPEAIVGVFAERSLEMVTGLIATLKAGGAYLPLDPTYPADRLAFMLGDAKPAVVLMQRRLAAQLPAHDKKVVFLEDDLAGESDTNPPNRTQPENLAYVLYTSGSTGQPKGVLIEQRAIVNQLLWRIEQYGLDSRDVFLQKTTFTFDVSVWELLLPPMLGARMVLLRPGAEKEPLELAAAIKRNQVTVIHFVPSMLTVFLESLEAKRSLGTLRRCFCGGESLTPELTKRFFDQFGDRTELHNLYGPTETAIDVTFYPVSSPEDTIPIGRPVANTSIYLLDRNKRPVPIGVAGELCIGGVQVARGYLNRPELTAERFIANPFKAGERLYRSGDLARWRADGNIEYLGRMDHQVKVRGFRIELGEIEAALLGDGGVAQTAVLVREDHPGEKRLIGYVVPAIAQSIDPAALRAHLNKSLPNYMVPVAIVVLEKLPLNANGKLDRKALPAPDLSTASKNYVAPRNELEEQLVKVWQEVLGVQPIGVTDDFFTLGGHSLLALRVVSRSNALSGKQLSLSAIFEAKTIAQLAQRLQGNDLTAGASDQDPTNQEKGSMPIARLPRAEGAAELVFPTSFAQQRLWFIDQLEPQSTVYNVPAAVRIVGELDIAAFEQSFSELVRRHEVLRTTFRAIDGQPIQVIARPSELRLPITDLRGLEPVARAEEERRLIAEEAGTHFDLARGPLLRARLLRTGDQEHVLVTTLHHIITDEWSNDLFLSELIAGYEAFAEGRQPNLPELSIQYADFAHWERASLQDGALEEQLGYWREKLADLPVLQLPTDRPRPAVPTFRGGSESIELPAELADALKALSRREGATVFMTLLTAFKALLARYTSQEDVVIGSPITNRTRSETENLIGFFLNTLVLRTALDGEPSFREALHRVSETVLGAFEHQGMPFDMLVQALAPERHLNQNPLFQVSLVVLNTRSQALRMGDLILDPIKTDRHSAKFDLTMFLFDGPEGIRGSLAYSADLFEAATIRRMVEHFHMLLEGIVAHPEARLSQLPILTGAEKDQIVVQWNRTQTQFPHEASISELFEQQVTQTPEAIAIEHGTTRWTYRELNERANRLAHALRDAGASAETLIGICLERSAEMIAAMLAILKAGGAYVPIDPAYPAARRSLMLEGVSFLVTTRQLAHEFADCTARVVRVDDKGDSAANKQNLPCPSNGGSLAYVIYTSGSTGQPKGVAIVHRAVNRLVINTNYIALDQSDVVAQTSNCCFDAATFEIWGALLNGARLVVLSKDLTLSPASFLKEIKQRGITTLWLTTSLFNLMAQHEPRAFAGLRNVLFGGEAADARSVAAVLKQGAPGRLINGYGPTETTTFAICHEVRSVPEEAASIPIGRPISNTTIYILDAHQNPVPIGVAGEIYIGGPGVARGYVGAPELTAERFLPDRFSSEPDARLYRTGDLARWLPDGTIEYLGRIDQQVKIRGFRIEPGEIEAALKQHPAVRDAVVVVGEHASGDKRLVAYVAGEVSALNDTALRDFLKAKLPDYMVPSAIVALEKFPLNANGKLDRHALPEPDQSAASEHYVAPRNQLEEQLVKLWQEVLGVQPLGVTNDFFALGGHSLLAVRIFAEIERIFGKKLPLATLFQSPTIEKLAAALREQGWQPSWSPLVAIQPRGLRPPFFAVHGGYGEVMFYSELARCLGEDQPFYGLQAEGLDGSPIRHTSIEAIARYYLQEIGRVQAHGPYFLGGYCTGGLVALEMAQQLRAAGEEVALLALFDTTHPKERNLRYPIKKRIQLALDEARALPSSEKMRYIAQRAELRLRWEISKLQKAGYDLKELLYRMQKPDKENTNGGPLPLKMPVWLMLHRAQSAYKPHAYPGRIVLFRAITSDGRQRADDRGWTGIAEGGLEIHDMPSKHGTLFDPRYMAAFAEKLDACIRRARTSELAFNDRRAEKVR